MQRTSVALLGVLLLSGCAYMTRSGLRKLGTYDLEHFPATLDPAVIRVAVEHDARIQVDLENTGLYLAWNRVNKEPLKNRFSPSLLASGLSVARGLSAAGPGRTWSLLGLSAEDLRWTSEVLQFLRPSESRNEEELKSSLERLFPGVEIDEKGEFDLQFNFGARIDFTRAPAVPRDKVELSVWVLLDGKDGFFQIVKGPVNLDQQ